MIVKGEGVDAGGCGGGVASAADERGDVEAALDEGIEICESCGRPVTWAFCPECGNEQEDGAVPPITVCPVCGVEMVPFCAHCLYKGE